MDRDEELAIVRRAYAKQIMAATGTDDPRVEAAFAEVRREEFLGDGPWPILRWDWTYRPTPNADPIYLYTDDLIGILPERQINNGQPSFHAMWIASAAPRPGEHVVHVGAGVGYYTAILAHLVGARGKVTAIEFHPGLAQRVARNFLRCQNVTVVNGDGSLVEFDAADVIYVNAGATRPADSWLDRLTDGGRLILPLTTDKGFNADEPGEPRRRGGIFLIQRRGSRFLARWLSPVAIFPCEGVRDTASEAALASAFEQGGWETVSELHRGDDLPTEHCWLRAPDWCLTRAVLA
jgi:protein-L-isoaspartate(D-aspartate) O-methyltransferase